MGFATSYLARSVVLTASLLLILVLSGMGAEAKSLRNDVNLSEFESCAGCEVTAARFLRLGDTEGEGMLEKETLRVNFDSKTANYVVYSVGSTFVQVFDSEGRFVRRIGTTGPGPGELAGISRADVLEGQIALLDYRNSKWLAFDFSGTLVAESRLRLRPGNFRLLGSGDIVLGVMGRGPDSVGYPLHHLELETGAMKRHFGSATGEWWQGRRPYAEEVLVERSSSDPKALWVADRGRLRFEEWTLDGSMRRVASGETGWFPDVRRYTEFGEKPETRMLEFKVTEDDQIWVVSWVPDDNWEKVARESIARPGVEKYVEDMSEYFDARVDVFDMRAGKHYGPYVVDQAYVRLIPLEQQMALSVTEETLVDGNIQSALYRLSLSTGR